ncbi:MAG: hypothetical protein H6719_32290 [Sandaracinaceae bacterium]|nr:hypothetical protein [Sandaracinaceae bacterium]
MSDSLEVWTSHRDVSDLVRELAPFVDDTSVRLPAGRRIPDGDWIRFSVHLLDGSKVFEGVGRCQESTQEGASTYRVRLSLLSFDERNEIMWERMLLAREDGAQATGNFDLRSLREKILKPPPSAPSKSVPPPPPTRSEPVRPPTLRPRPPAGRPPLPPARPKPSTRPPPPSAIPPPAPLPRPSSFPPPRPSSFPPPRRPVDAAPPLPKLGALPAVPRAEVAPKSEAPRPPPKADPPKAEPPKPELPAVPTKLEARPRPRPTPIERRSAAPMAARPEPEPLPEPEPSPEPEELREPDALPEPDELPEADEIEPTPTRVGPTAAFAEAEATSTEIFAPAPRDEDDSGSRTEPPPPNAEAALAPTAERTSPSVPAPRAPSDDTSASHALSDQTHAGLRLEVPARLVERARALAPNLPPGVLRIQPVRETPEEAVLRAALSIGLASLAALSDTDDDP